METVKFIWACTWRGLIIATAIVEFVWLLNKLINITAIFIPTHPYLALGTGYIILSVIIIGLFLMVCSADTR